MSVTASQLVARVSVEGFEETSRKLGETGRKSDETESSFKKLRETLARGFEFAAGMSAFDMFARGFDLVKEQLLDTVKLAAAHEQIESQTAQALKSTRDVSGETAGALGEMADAFSRTTMYSADTVQSGENLLLTFTNIGKNVFPQATQAILDVSQAMHQDLKESAIQVGKALGDPIHGVGNLMRIGVTFSAQEKEQIKTAMAHNDILTAQKIILKELATEFGGSAQAAGQTFGGQVQILSNKFEDLKIKIGQQLLPVLSEFMLKYVQPLLQNFIDWTNHGSNLHDVIQGLSNVVGGMLGGLATFASDVGAIVGWFQQAGPQGDILKFVLTGIGVAIAGVKMAQLANDISSMATKAADFAQNAGPKLVAMLNGTQGISGAADAASTAEKGVGETAKTTMATDVATGATEAKGSIAEIGVQATETEGTVATASSGMQTALSGVLTSAIGVLGVMQVMQSIQGLGNLTQDSKKKGNDTKVVQDLNQMGLPGWIEQWLANLLSGPTDNTTNASGNADDPSKLLHMPTSVPRRHFAAGGIAPGGWVGMNELGPEGVQFPGGGQAAYLPAGTRVIPNNQLGSGGGGGAPIHVHVNLAGHRVADVLMDDIVATLRLNTGQRSF